MGMTTALLFDPSMSWMEFRSISPTLEEDRTDKRLYQMFFLWLSVNTNIPAFSFGTAGPAFFNLGLRDAILIILVADPMCVAFTKFLKSDFQLINTLPYVEQVSSQPLCMYCRLWRVLKNDTIHSTAFGPKLGTRAMVQARFSWGCNFITRLVILDISRPPQVTSDRSYRVF